jgi:hypothetical protein
MKKFGEFLKEASGKKNSSHGEANAIIAKHGQSGDIDHEGAGEYSPDAHFHSHGIHPKKVGELHVALKAAGFHKHEGDHHEPYGGSNSYPPDHKQDHYHKYTKGKTSVLVANHKNHDSGHVVEVHTPK